MLGLYPESPVQPRSALHAKGSSVDTIISSTLQMGKPRVRCWLQIAGKGQGWNWTSEPVAPAVCALSPCLRVCGVRRCKAFPFILACFYWPPGLLLLWPSPCPAHLIIPSLCQQFSRQSFIVLIKPCKVEVQEYFLLMGDL